MKPQTFGKILESEYQALNELQYPLAYSVFAEMKRKYRGTGTSPDYLNAQELKAVGISERSYRRIIIKLLSVGLIRVASMKNIGGFPCRLYSFPHEEGNIQTVTQTAYGQLGGQLGGHTDRQTVTQTAYGQLGGHTDRLGGHTDRLDGHTDRPLRLDKEDKKEDKEDKSAVKDSSLIVSSVDSSEETFIKNSNVNYTLKEKHEMAEKELLKKKEEKILAAWRLKNGISIIP